MSYAEALRRLQALDDKRVARNAYVTPDDGCGCIVTIMAPSARLLPDYMQRVPVQDLLQDSRRVDASALDEAHQPLLPIAQAVLRELEEAGLSLGEAIRMQSVCDWQRGAASERYTHMEGWFKARIEEENNPDSVKTEDEDE